MAVTHEHRLADAGFCTVGHIAGSDRLPGGLS
jgi:hypothetical protein